MTYHEAVAELRQRTIIDHKEHLFLMVSGECTPIKDGTNTMIDFEGTPKYDAQVMVHSHPIEMSFSWQDIEATIGLPNLRRHEVVTATKLYRLSKPEGWRLFIDRLLMFRMFVNFAEYPRINTDEKYRHVLVTECADILGLIYEVKNE